MKDTADVTELQSLLFDKTLNLNIFCCSEALAHVIEQALLKAKIKAEKQQHYELFVELPKENQALFAKTVNKTISIQEMQQTLVKTNEAVISEIPLFRLNALFEARWLIELVMDENITVAFQAVLHAKTHEIYGYDCLFRLVTSKFLVSTGKIFSMAENAGFLAYLDNCCRHVVVRNIKEAKFDLGKFFIRFYPDSSVDLMDSFKKTEEYIIQYGLNKDDFIFEIAKIDVWPSIDAVLDVAKVIKSLGFKLGLQSLKNTDDNLRLIKESHPDYVQLAPQFINNIHCNKKEQQGLLKTVALIKALGAYSIALNVELEEEKNFLEDAGIDFLQGFYFLQATFFD